MKIYKILQNVNNDYDTYDSAVVCVESEEEAVKYHPGGEYDYKETGKERFEKCEKDYGTWAKKKYVKIEYIGEADESIEKGVIVASFNAG